jgi:pheromone alpha factor receptor
MSFNPKNQTFLIAGPQGIANITISMAVIDAQRVRLANLCISYGVQLGLSLMMLLAILLLTPLAKMKKAVHAIHVWSLVIAVIKGSLLILYFPGPLSEYYVAWTRDSKALERSDYNTNTTANAFDVVLFTLIETALIIQSWGLIRTWAVRWQCLVKATSISLAIATIVVKSIWIYHHTVILEKTTLPVTLNSVGRAGSVLGAVSIFYFCGLFFANLTVHMMCTRGILQRPQGALTSLEILAIGNGVLMILPSKSRYPSHPIRDYEADIMTIGVFAGLDVAASISGTRVLPFDAGSWVETLVVVGLPLTGLIAKYRGPSSRDPSQSHSAFAISPLKYIKPTASRAGETTLVSPVAESFMASLEGARKGSTRSREQTGDAVASSDGGEEDPELGIHVQRDILVTVSNEHLAQPGQGT